MSGPQQKLVNKQFNSPIGLYSEENIKAVLERESQMLANGAVGINFHNPSAMTKPANLHNSAVLRMLEEEESRQRNGQSQGAKRVAWPPPKDEEEEGDFEEQEAAQAQGGAQFSSKAPGLLSTSQTTPFNNNQQAPVVAQTYQPNKAQVFQPDRSVGSSPQPYQPKPQPQSVGFSQPKQSVGSPQPGAKEANWTTYLPDQSIGSPQPKPQQPAWAPVAQPKSPQAILPTAPQPFRQEYTIPIHIESRAQPTNQPNLAPTYKPIQSVSSPQAKSEQSVGANEPQQPKQPIGSSQPNPSVASPKPKLPTWAPAFKPSQSIDSPQPKVIEPNWTTFLPPQTLGSPQPKTQQPAWADAAKSPASFRQEYTIPIQIEPRVQPTTNKPNQDQIPVQPSAGPQGQAQQQFQPQYKPAPVKQVEPPPSIITLRPTVPISQAPAPVITSQPATATLRGGKNLRGDMKWPPEDVKEKMDAENKARVELAKGPAVRPRKVHKDYSGFFAQHALNSTYPGYKVPPGTQYYEHHPVM